MSFFEQPALSAVITVYSFALAVFCLYGLARAIGETLSKRAIAAYAPCACILQTACALRRRPASSQTASRAF